METPTNSSVRFGVFELDARAGELRRSGHRVALQPQPLEILRALIERPGEVVTREELRRRVWSNGAYVDFDRSLNKAIVKLRDALGSRAPGAGCVAGRNAAAGGADLAPNVSNI